MTHALAALAGVGITFAVLEFLRWLDHWVQINGEDG